MEKLEPLELYRKWLIRQPKPVKTIRASTQAGYWYCSENARLQALGVQAQFSSEVAKWGTVIHDDILDARKITPLELEFKEALAPFYKLGEDKQPIISRTYKNTKIKADGTFLTHGADEWKVEPDRKCWLIEYKTKSRSYVTPVDISPARFQNKLYCWLHAPIFEFIPFTLAGGQIIFLQRKGKFGDFKPIGQTEKMYWNEETERTFLEDMEHILWSWNNPTKQIPPKRWKCLHCSPIFKEKCFFQTGEVWNGQ